MLKVTYKNTEILVTTLEEGYRWLQKKGARRAEDIHMLENLGVWKISIEDEWSAERVADQDRSKM